MVEMSDDYTEEDVRRTGILISGFDLFDITRFINRKAKKHMATLLSELEEVIEDKELYATVRKLVLDSDNNLVRSIVRSIFGDVS